MGCRRADASAIVYIFGLMHMVPILPSHSQATSSSPTRLPVILHQLDLRDRRTPRPSRRYLVVLYAPKEKVLGLFSHKSSENKHLQEAPDPFMRLALRSLMFLHRLGAEKSRGNVEENGLGIVGTESSSPHSDHFSAKA